jgi:hypothetical protein
MAPISRRGNKTLNFRSKHSFDADAWVAVKTPSGSRFLRRRGVPDDPIANAAPRVNVAEVPEADVLPGEFRRPTAIIRKSPGAATRPYCVAEWLGRLQLELKIGPAEADAPLCVPFISALHFPFLALVGRGIPFHASLLAISFGRGSCTSKRRRGECNRKTQSNDHRNNVLHGRLLH